MYRYFGGTWMIQLHWRYWVFPFISERLACQVSEFVLVWVAFFYIIHPNNIKNMSKIKDLLEKFKTQWAPYHDLRLIVAKRVWLLFALLYYLVYLFTVGGFYIGDIISLENLSTLHFHLYSVLVIATGWMIFSLGEYIIALYAPSRKWLLIIPSVLALSLVAVSLLVHLKFL